MSKDIPAIMNMELRGEILAFLHDIYPYDIGLTSIYQSYFQYYETNLIDQALQYLEDKGYIRKHQIKGTRYFDMVNKYSITPNGIDLLEGAIDDKGIIIRRD